jgi:hypothetical protein
MEATQTEKVNSTETEKPKTAEERIAEARARLQQNAIANPLEDAADLDRRLTEFVEVFHFSSVIAASVVLAIIPASADRLVWEARFAFHFKPKGNAKRTMFWTKRDRATAENSLKFFLENCGTGGMRLTSTNEALRARKDVSPIEFERIFDLEAYEENNG